MAYEVPSYDTSTRQKMLHTMDTFAPSDADILKYLEMLRGQGQKSLQESFGAAQANIGAQFTPAMRLASARLAGSPMLADSGYANRLNRQIQTAAFSDLARAQGTAAAQQAGAEGSALQNLINQRLAYRQQIAQNLMGATEKKKKGGAWRTAAQVGGAAVGGFFGGPGGASVGYGVGGSF